MSSKTKTLEEVYEQLIQEGRLARYAGAAAAAAGIALGSDDIPKPRPGKSITIPPEYLTADIPKPRPGKSITIPLSPLDKWLSQLKSTKITDIDVVLNAVTGLPEIKKDSFNKTAEKSEDIAKKQIISDISSKISLHTKNQLLSTLK